MLKMRHAALAATAFCGLLAAGAARADVIYTFTGNPVPTDQIFTPSVRVDVPDATVASGSLNVSGSLRGNILTGDTDWTSLGYAFIGPVVSSGSVFPHTDGTYSGNVSFSLTLNFSPDDTLTSSNVHVDDGSGDTLTVVGSTIGIGSGAYELTFDGSAPNEMGCRSPCAASGTWTSVNTNATPAPEPASFALLGFGVVGFAALRRQLKTQAMPSV